VRKIKGEAELESAFAHPLMLARRVREQRQHQRGRKVYSLHAPEVQCIGKGKAHRPYEFGVKVSLGTTLHRSRGGQFIAHAKALPGNPYDGHTLAIVIPEIETQVGASLTRIVADRGYRGHNAPPDHKFKVYISGQRRRVTATIKRELRRRSAVEPVIGHAKSEHRMGRNYLAGTHGDAANAVLAAAGYNFRRLLEWLALLLSVFLAALHRPSRSENASHRRPTAFFTVDLQTWPMQTHFPSSGCGQSRPGPGRPPAKLALMSRAIVPAAAYQIEAMKARSTPASTPTYFPAAG
jgi:IS5 family transposase